MAAESHLPNTRGALCNAGAGAAAGMWKRSVFLICFSRILLIRSDWIEFIFWVVLGAIAATFVCPLDVIKTRFQVHGLPKLANGSVKGMFFNNHPSFSFFNVGILCYFYLLLGKYEMPKLLHICCSFVQLMIWGCQNSLLCISIMIIIFFFFC